VEEQRKVYADAAARALAAAGRRPRRPVEFRSQGGEDAFLWDLLEGQLEGFYIEVGAYNGLDYSVSYAFDCIGWDGLLIEPIPERYRECAANRPTARVVHAALGPPGQPPTTTFNVTDDIFGGMLSSVTGGHGLPEEVRSTRPVEVPFTTMDALLAGHTRGIDFAVIDVEGFEVPLLQGFNLEKYRPRVLMVECRADDESVMNYLFERSYRPIGRQSYNAVFARADIAEALAVRLYGPDAFG
jgi:FkbM family methyltransferase